ncbi:DUF1330 domain-containing protein [SAR202 cluster bacterium AC-647-N09_OGT_505m]|nr:DUF1330 domain-containing protein [SAR202 cluster bacterium AC-647-N09_OGT_505m]
MNTVCWYLLQSKIWGCGGGYLVRGDTIEKVEGTWQPSRMVVIEFESMEQLKKWYHSHEYSGPMQLRHEPANANVLFVEGVQS